MKRLYLLLAVLVCTMAFVSCDKAGGDNGGKDSYSDFVTFMVDPLRPILSVGETCDLTVEGVYSNNTKKDITSQCEFSIYEGVIDREPAISLVNNKVTALQKGAAAVVVEFDGRQVNFVPITINQ